MRWNVAAVVVLVLTLFLSLNNGNDKTPNDPFETPSDAVEAPARMLAEGLNTLCVAPDSRSGVVATDQLVAQALH